jgi:hypothetical protein
MGIGFQMIRQLSDQKLPFNLHWEDLLNVLKVLLCSLYHVRRIKALDVFVDRKSGCGKIKRKQIKIQKGNEYRGKIDEGEG